MFTTNVSKLLHMYIHFLEILLHRVHTTNIATTITTTTTTTTYSTVVSRSNFVIKSRNSCIVFFSTSFLLHRYFWHGLVSVLRNWRTQAYSFLHFLTFECHGYILCVVLIAYVFITIIISVNRTILLTQIMIHYENSHFLHLLTFLVDRPVDK